jgi:hypothetical protein
MACYLLTQRHCIGPIILVAFADAPLIPHPAATPTAAVSEGKCIPVPTAKCRSPRRLQGIASPLRITPLSNLLGSCGRDHHPLIINPPTVPTIASRLLRCGLPWVDKESPPPIGRALKLVAAAPGKASLFAPQAGTDVRPLGVQPSPGHVPSSALTDPATLPINPDLALPSAPNPAQRNYRPASVPNGAGTARAVVQARVATAVWGHPAQACPIFFLV